jgi:hypothetical protein
LTGDDFYHEPDQSKISPPLVEDLLEFASGKDENGNRLLLKEDFSAYTGQRRADARATNPEYTSSLFHRMVSSSKYVS